jgi:hypothetical protein
VNLEPSIAITQNFVPKAHLSSAVRFLRDKADQVSGFKDDVKDPYSLFIERLKEVHPDLAASVESASTKKRKWEDVVGEESSTANSHAFSFGFGNDLEDEIE